MQVSEGASRIHQDKSGRWESPGKRAKFKCHDKLSKWQIVCFFSTAMKPNGPVV
jgi:hypothetical protein